MTDSTTQHVSDIPDTGQHLEQSVQYGVKFPNGTIAWGKMSGTGGGKTINFEQIAQPDRLNQTTWRYWTEVLTERAKLALVPLEEYAEQHTFVKRTLIIAVTEHEDTGRAAMFPDPEKAPVLPPWS